MYFGAFFGPNRPNNVFQEVPPIALMLGLKGGVSIRDDFGPLSKF